MGAMGERSERDGALGYRQGHWDIDVGAERQGHSDIDVGQRDAALGYRHGAERRGTRI